MKRLSRLIWTLCMVFVLTACGAQADDNTLSDQETAAAPQSENESKTEEESQTDALPSDAETSDVGESVAEESEAPEENNSKVLVVYFSCTGNTKGVAEKVTEALGADTYEIVPEQPYTEEDLNYNDRTTRATAEQDDPDARPGISGSVQNMGDYDTVFIGYPIWWGQAPKIMYTFMESYDFSGKTIVPFCTSGSSGVGSSAANLHDSASDSVNWLDGIRFSSDASESDIENWLNGLELE